MEIQDNDYNLKAFYTNIMKENALLYKYQFVVTFVGLDEYGITNSADPSQNITYYMQSANVPGQKLSVGTTDFLGTKFRIPGVKQFSHEWAPTILIDQTMFGYKGLQNWRRDISRLEIDGGGIKVIPNVQARISLLSADHQKEVTSYVMEGVWIKGLDQIDLKYQEGGSSDPVKIKANFRYQYVYEDPDFNLSDPLGKIS